MSISNLAARFGTVKPSDTVESSIQGVKVAMRRVRRHEEFAGLIAQALEWAEDARAKVTDDLEYRNMLGDIERDTLTSCRMMALVTIPEEGETVDAMTRGYVTLALNGGAVYLKLSALLSRAIGVVDEVVQLAAEGKRPCETTCPDESPCECREKFSDVTPTSSPETP